MKYSDEMPCCIALLTVALIFTLGSCASIPGVKTTEPFDYAEILDKGGNYFLFWNVNDTHVTFEVHVKTKGYVGFGFSDNGNMFPGDVIVGWVKDGVTHFAVSMSNYSVMALAFKHNYVSLVYYVCNVCIKEATS